MSLSSIPERTTCAEHSKSNATTDFDLVVVGFGTAGLSLATALADRGSKANILFLEKQGNFTWQPANVLPDSTVRTSFLRDLITTRNPRSEFTFLNYLHETNQMVQFTNLSQLAPSRLVMGNYFAWVAERMVQRGWVWYGADALRVNAVKNAQQQVSQWTIDVRDCGGETGSITSKRVVLAVGSKPRIPASLASPGLTDHVLHSSACGSLLDNLRDQHIAIVGANQEAAEIFEHLQAAGARHRVRATLFIPDSALRPEDNTPFLQDIVDDSNSILPPELRSRLLSTDAPSPHSCIALHTIERLYDMQYTQRIQYSNPNDWRFRLESCSQVTSAQMTENGKLRLEFDNPRTGATRTSSQAFDVVIAAGGYEYELLPALLSSISDAGLLEQRCLTVDKEYNVNLRRGALATGCGLWCLGSLEEGKIRDDVFTYAAERAQRCVGSVLAAMEVDPAGKVRVGEVAML